ncbi:MAG: hydantoinase/oxoprolinase family protein [Methyloceanibacter sp.]|uniref:hydantoinase/oxoprolinase family protein n=1 Tax=Methyloceanibacter sp. TaxID=1965321 RepID=UPI003D6D3D7D
MAASFGWDLGGANLKLARVEGGRVLEVVQIPCPVLGDRSKFDLAVEEALKICPPGARHAVTMTGELSDVFQNRAEGVAYLVGLMRKATGAETGFYGLRSDLLDADQAVERWQEVASANWHASAALAAKHCGDGLLVDVGTTTTDLIPLKDGKETALGLNDGQRLFEGELIYVGVVRTPVMAIAQAAPFKGRMQSIAAERFATMADVYRLTGDLPDDADPYPAADQRGKSIEESAARLARMLGRDAGEADLIAWKALAHFFARRQLDQIEGVSRALFEREALPREAPVIGAGCGRFLAQSLAKRLDRPYRDFAGLIDCAPEAREMAAACAPAVAVALLFFSSERAT